MINRTRRLRRNKIVRDMVSETSISKNDLIYPLFVVEGEGVKDEIPSMTGQFRYSIDNLLLEIKDLLDLGINSIILFGIPNSKDPYGKSSYDENGIIQKAVRKIKEKHPKMYVITDLCMCEYTSHGHCGILDEDGYVNNDKTLDSLSKIALSHARAGADMIAPSDMMDGRVKAIRDALDGEGFVNVPIMSYSAKYSSSFYGPFRDAADSAPSFGDRKTYQMDYRNSDEALRETEFDILEGCDLVIVKPALTYLDVVRRVKDNFNIPICAYFVSGEYQMLRDAVDKGLLNEDAILEAHYSIKRAGAKLIITYFAKDIAKKLI